MKLRKPTPDPPRPRILPGPGSSPAPEPPWDRVSPAGSAPARNWGRAPDRGFVVVLITGPVRVLVPVPVLSFASVLHAGAGCAPARGRRRESLRARSRRESGHRLAPRPRRRTGAAGEAAPREPAGVPPGPATTPGGADPVGAGRARGGRSWRGPSPGRVRAREGCSAGSWRCSPVRTTCVPLDHGGPTVVLECEVHVSASGAQRCRAPRSARSPGNPRDRHLTRENVC